MSIGSFVLISAVSWSWIVYTKVCDSSKQACKNLKRLYNKAKGSKAGGRIDASTDEWKLKAYANKGSLTANIHLMAYHKERKVKYEAMMTYKRKNKFSSCELMKE